MQKVMTIVALLAGMAGTASATIGMLWSRSWSGVGRRDDEITQIALDNASNVYTTGIGWDSVSGNFGFVTAKYDTWGNLAWRSIHRTFPNADTFVGIVLDVSNNVYVAGTDRTPGRGKEIRVLKYDGLTGARLWSDSFNALSDTSEDQFIAMTYDRVNTRLYVCGASYNGPSRKFDYAVLRLDPGSGNIVWSSLYDWNNVNHGDDVPAAMCLSLTGDPIVTGRSWDNNDAVSDWLTMKFRAATGVVESTWANFGRGRIRRDPGNEEEWPYAICADAHGNLFVTGFGYNNALGYYVMQTVKHNGATGDTVRRRVYTAGDDDNWGKGIRYGNNGRVYIFAHYYDAADPFNLSAEDWGIVCYDTSNLNWQWASFVDGGHLGRDEAWDMVIDNQGRPYVTGACEDTITKWTQWRTVRFDPATGARTLDLKYCPAPTDTVDNQARSIAVTDTNHIYVGGYTSRWNASWDRDMRILRYGGSPVPVHDVGATRIFAPSGTLDSGSLVVPACSVYNYGNQTETFNARMRIYPSYDNAALVSGLAPGSGTYVTFPSWVGPMRGWNILRCSTELSGDSVPGNDRRRDSVFAHVHDVGCSQLLAPMGTVLPDSVFTPACSLLNYGNQNEGSYTVRMTVGTPTPYNQTRTVPAHALGARLYVTFPAWTANPPGGPYAVVCSTELSGDYNWRNGRQSGTVSVVPGQPDVTVQHILLPRGAHDSGVTVIPACSVYNNGTTTASYNIRMKVAGCYNQTAVVLNHVQATRIYITFPDWTVVGRGTRAVTCSTELDGDIDPSNDLAHSAVRIEVHDIGAAGIVAPSGTIVPGAITPQARVRNLGTLREGSNVTFMIDAATPYEQSVSLPTGLPFADTLISFASWTAVVGSFNARCSVHLATDQVAVNNVLSSPFVVSVSSGWERREDLPTGAKGKGVKDGGTLAYAPETDAGLVYAFKGNGRCEFYQYNIADNAWVAKESIPAVGSSGRKKAVKKGASITDADGVMFAAKGNGTLEWWKYDPALSGGPTYPWTEKTSVPTGAKAIKEGSGSAMVKVGDTTFIYFLKGSSTQEFYRYNATSNSWATMTNAPSGTSGKPYKNGSALCASEDGSTVFAVKGSYNEFYAYDVATNAWTTKTPLPMTGSSGKKKKVKDGAGLAFLNSTVYCLKGGGTREFWTYQADSDKWTQLEDMPSGGGKPVKGGGALTAADDKLFAFKGNNTLEFYSYRPAVAYGSQLAANRQKNAQSGSASSGPQFALSVAPSLFSQATTIRYSLPSAGNASLKLYDITGQLITTLASGYHNAGTSSLRLSPSSLSSGIYVLKLTTDGSTTTAKLIVE